MSFQKPLDKFGSKTDYSALGTSFLRQLTAKYSTNGRSLAEFPFNSDVRSTGTTGLITSSGNGLLLAAGYRYRVTVLLQVYQAGSTWTSYYLKFNGGGVDSIYFSNGYNG